MDLFFFISTYCKDITLNQNQFLEWGKKTAIGRDGELKDIGRGMLLFGLVKTIQPKKVLEIGTGRGYSLICMHKACCDSQYITIDPDNQHKERIQPGDIKLSVVELVREQIYFDDKNIKFLTGRSEKLVPKLLNNDHFDFIFVDGSHKKDVVLKDAENAMSLLNKGGCIVFHDYQHESTPGVTQALDQKMSTLQKHFQVIPVNTDGNFIDGVYVLNEKMGCLVCLPKGL